MSQLTLRYEFDESSRNERLLRDDFGVLTLAVDTDDFSGTGSFWVQWQDVRRYGDSLAAFPITSPIEEHWRLGADLILGISIGPANVTGDLLVWVEIADQHEPSRRVRTSFATNYPDVDAFRRSIAHHMDRNIDKAVLLGR